MLDLEPYIGFEARHLHPRITTWLEDAAARGNLRAALEEDVAVGTDPVGLERYRAQCAVADARTSEYALRELDLGDDGRVIAGIHFAGVGVRDPFVGVLARTRALADTGALARMARRLSTEFATFAPRRFRLWACEADVAVHLARDARTGMCVVAGRLDELRARPPRATRRALDLEPCSASHVYADYLATFERFFAAHPSWRGRIQVETEARLREAERTGVLARAIVDGEPAGFFAAVPAAERALVGYVMLEEILDTPFRGCGLAPTLQRMFLDHVAALDPGALLFGHIERDNTASLRTALACGRTEVYRTVYLPM